MSKFAEIHGGSSDTLFSVCIFARCEKHHGECIDELNDAHLSGQNNHPKSAEEAMTHLSHCVDQNDKGSSRMMSLAQTDVECYHCHEKGHIATNCPKSLAKKAEKKSEKQLTQFEATMEKWNRSVNVGKD